MSALIWKGMNFVNVLKMDLFRKDATNKPKI